MIGELNRARPVDSVGLAKDNIEIGIANVTKQQSANENWSNLNDKSSRIEWTKLNKVEVVILKRRQ